MIKRSLILAIAFCWIAAGSPVAGQEWARKMFTTTSHDFGSVPRGSHQEFGFKVKNIYKEDVHITSVRSSCGCTSPRITKESLKTHETGEIRAQLNTRSFLGAKSATITVTIDKPYYAEVQLVVSTYIRSDVVLTPGAVDFGSTDLGQGTKKSVAIAYAGKDDWEIVDVRGAGEFFEVELEELQRGSGRVNYNMIVHLKPGAPAGYVQDQLTLITNDTGAHTVSVPVIGRVVSPMTVSPASLYLGVLKPGETVTKRLVVRSSKPFRILQVKCEDDAFHFQEPAAEAKSLHFVSVEYKAGDEPGKLVEQIEIATDLAGGLQAACVATATIQR